MILAQVGPVTDAMEALASTIGAGMLIGGFLAGGAGVVRGRTGTGLEKRALASGYIGGTAAVAFSLVDLFLRYGF